MNDLKQQPLSRRDFLQQTALAGAAILGAPAFVSCRAPSEKLNVVIIGCGGRGAHNMGQIAGAGENIVALCDVNANNLGQAAKQAHKARQFRDFRKLYDQMKDSEFDAVVVSTTEHTHAFATLPALQRKKHVYCEKPLTHNLKEARIIREAAAKVNVATQLGTQNHANDNYRRVVELVQSGAIGPVHEVHVWVSRAWGWQTEEDAKKYGDRIWTFDRPKESEPVPPDLDWDLWLGPAPYRPYNSVYVPGYKWYRWWDFGNGTMSDLGAHYMDLPFWALKLDAPKAVEASGPPPHPEIAPASFSVAFHYGPRSGGLPPVKVTWYQGAAQPAPLREGKIPLWKDGFLFIGSRGMLLANYTRNMLLPEKEFADFKRPEQSIPKSLGHHKEWIHACKTGAPTLCPFSYSGLLTEANHLGSVAYRSGRRIEWDPKTMRLPNAPEAEQFLGRVYRKGWTLG